MKRSAKTFSHEAGCIIIISSLFAFQADPNREVYATTKAGLALTTPSIAMSGEQWGIRVNAVVPGLISAWYETKAGDQLGAVIEEVMTGGRPEDISSTIEYLMNANFTTGQRIVVDGGAQKVIHR